ncbi:unnamed protein product, partial [Amoebophrya sp. A25]
SAERTRRGEAQKDKKADLAGAEFLLDREVPAMFQKALGGTNATALELKKAEERTADAKSSRDARRDGKHVEGIKAQTANRAADEPGLRPASSRGDAVGGGSKKRNTLEYHGRNPPPASTTIPVMRQNKDQQDAGEERTVFEGRIGVTSARQPE